MRNSASSILDNHSPYLWLRKKLKDFSVLLKFCTPSYFFKQRLQLLMNTLEHHSYDALDVEKKMLCEKMLTITKRMRVPSLKELSRDVSRAYITARIGEGTSLFYTTIKFAHLPQVVKNILCLQYPVNDIEIS